MIAGGCLLHDIGMSIHRDDHEAFSLFLALRHARRLLASVYEEPEQTVVISEIQHAIIGHRSDGRPLTLEAGVVRVADALDMEHGRTAWRSSGLPNIHSLSAAAIDEVRIVPGEQRAGPRRDRDEQLRRRVPGRRAAGRPSCAARGSRTTSRWSRGSTSEHEKRLLRVYQI